jgi:hypothetical protein
MTLSPNQASAQSFYAVDAGLAASLKDLWEHYKGNTPKCKLDGANPVFQSEDFLMKDIKKDLHYCLMALFSG